MTKEEIMKTISDVKHPAIDHFLPDLGIVKNVRVDDDKVKITFSFPLSPNTCYRYACKLN